MSQIFSKILVCCDGSKYSEKAIRLACDLSKTYNSQLILIHVIDKTRKSDFLAGSEYTNILRKYAKEVIVNAQKITNEQGITTKVVTKEGNVANEIVNYSKENKIDLILVGSKGLGAVMKFLLGSISIRVANISLCSILIVK